MAEKSEKATPKKLRDARKKGQIAKSQDFPSAATFIVAIWALLGLSGYFYDHLTGFIVDSFKAVGAGQAHKVVPEMFGIAIKEIFITVIPMMGLVAAVGMIVNVVVTGPVFAPEVFKFDIKKFNPIQNLKAKFKLKTLVELIKSILKITISGWIIYGVMYKSFPVLIQAVRMPLSSALIIFHAFLFEVVIKIGLFFIAVAMLDLIYQKINFANEMKMEKFEVKQEYKNTEGDPQIKSKRRQTAQEIAYSDSPVTAAGGAKVLVTNPTHLAIALAYERHLDAAPYIIGMGQDYTAERMIQAAKENGVPVVRNIKLAHRLWVDGEVYDFVPEDTYEIVAEIMRWLSSLDTEWEYQYISD